MARFKIIYLLLLTYYVYAASEEAEDRIISLKPPDALALQKSAPYKKESSFFSRLTSWFFPSTDSVPAEGHHSGPQYLPPHPYQSQSGCNPCNQEPWIPVASNLGHNTLINFIPPSSHLGNLRPPQYAPPVIFKPKPDKINYGLPIENLRPPPVTYLKPVSPRARDYGTPIDMRPPPLNGGSYHSLPPTQSNINYYLPPPPPPPSDSYGDPVVGPNSNFQIRPEYLPPTEQLPLPSDYPAPIPLPNLSASPVLPIHNAQNFRDNVPQHGTNYEVKSHDVQVVPSVKVADFLATVEHPINVIQSPLVEVSVKHSESNVDENGDVRPEEFYENKPPRLNGDVRPEEFYENKPPRLNGDVRPEEFYENKPSRLNGDVRPEEFYENKPSRLNGDVRSEGFYENDPPRLSENPIVVEDTHTAATALNITFQESNLNLPSAISQSSYRSEDHDETLNTNFIKQLLLQKEVVNKSFTPPPLDYSQWKPTVTVASSMVPPPASPTTWLHPISPEVTTTKKPKQIQIIIPYISNKKPLPFEENRRPIKPYSTLLPVYSPPSSTEEIWSKFIDDFKLAESKKVTATAFTPPPPPPTTQVYNIRDLLKDSRVNYKQSEKLPFDVISLQNNIDDWTQQEYSKSIHQDQKITTNNNKFVPSKQIPDDYLTTQPYETTTTISFDHEQASSNKKETKAEEDIETNLIFKETTTEITTTEKPKNLWETASVTVSPLTKEKVYIVTPQPITSWSHPPQIQNHTSIPKFLVRVDPEDPQSREKLKQRISPLTVVFSEWPHLINNLQTTTTMKSPTSKHPLLGLMELASYTPPPNSTVQTISGHSKVVTVVTPASVTERHTRKG